jgi:hypothetical protein
LELDELLLELELLELDEVLELDELLVDDDGVPPPHADNEAAINNANAVRWGGMVK